MKARGAISPAISTWLNRFSTLKLYWFRSSGENRKEALSVRSVVLRFQSLKWPLQITTLKRGSSGATHRAV